MKERHADQGHRKFWATMKELTWKKRIQHFVYYYGLYTVIAILLAVMLGDMIYQALKPKPEVILSGTAVNVHVTMDMQEVLIDGVFARMGTDSNNQKVTLVANEFTTSDLYLSSGLQTKLLAGEYHYALMDQKALDGMLAMQTLPNMTYVLSEESLAQLEGRFIYVQSEGEKFPVAVDITDTLLAKGCTFTGDRLYLGFPVTAETAQPVQPFFDYLMEQGLLEKQ